MLQKTLFGWIVAGSISVTGSKRKSLQTNCNLSVIGQTIQKFREIEGCVEAKNVTAEEKYCERLFIESHSRQEEGRFVIKLPVKEEVLSLLNDSREITLKRFLSVERRFAKEPNLKAEYVSFMQEYLKLGHMRPVNTSQTKLKVYLHITR